MTTDCFVLARAVHFGACLLFFSLYASDFCVLSAAGRNSSLGSYWTSRTHAFSVALLPIILLSGMAWFGCVAITMSGESPHFEILKTVWAGTQFGTLSKVRLACWLSAVGVALPGFFVRKQAFQNSLKSSQLILSGGLLASLAWAGHGRENSPWHLPADILHLLAAGFWPTGLLPLALLLNRFAKTSAAADWTIPAALVRRFSAISLGSVALLAATGIVNSWSLLPSFSSLFTQPYGRWLAAKIALFFITIAIGAVNLLRLKPRLLRAHSQSQSSNDIVLQLRRNVLLEIILGTAIVIIVAILGVLPP